MSTYLLIVCRSTGLRHIMSWLQGETGVGWGGERNIAETAETAERDTHRETETGREIERQRDRERV